MLPKKIFVILILLLSVHIVGAEIECSFNEVVKITYASQEYEIDEKNDLLIYSSIFSKQLPSVEEITEEFKKVYMPDFNGTASLIYTLTEFFDYELSPKTISLIIDGEERIYSEEISLEDSSSEKYYTLRHNVLSEGRMYKTALYAVSFEELPTHMIALKIEYPLSEFIEKRYLTWRLKTPLHMKSNYRENYSPVYNTYSIQIPSDKTIISYSPEENATLSKDKTRIEWNFGTEHSKYPIEKGVILLVNYQQNLGVYLWQVIGENNVVKIVALFSSLYAIIVLVCRLLQWGKGLVSKKSAEELTTTYTKEELIEFALWANVYFSRGEKELNIAKKIVQKLGSTKTMNLFLS